jgi:MoaA/NifB/PqqE/SkfB family radical SAM enzyme
VAAAKQCGGARALGRLHGYGAEHDRQLNRPSAFAETCLAVRRAQECGLGTGANVFLTKPAVRDFDRLLAVLLGLRLDMFNITVAGYTPTPRGRRYEALRPELADLRPIAQRVLDESLLGREEWAAWNRTRRRPGRGAPTTGAGL